MAGIELHGAPRKVARLRVSAGPEMQLRDRGKGVGAPWLEHQSHAKFDHRLIFPAKPGVGVSEVVMRVGAVRIEVEARRVCGDRLIELPLSRVERADRSIQAV